MKRKVSAGIIPAVLLMLLAAGAVATALNWDAIRFLYGREETGIAGLMTPVGRKAEAGGVSLEINSAVTDGRVLAFDWTLTADECVLPVYLQVDKVSIDEIDHIFMYPAVGTGLNRVWITRDERIVRSGELVRLWTPVPEGESIHMELTVGVYKPKRDVVLFSTPEQDIYELPGGAALCIRNAYRTSLSLQAEVDLVIEGVKTEEETALKWPYYSFGFTDDRGDYLQGQNFTAGLWSVAYYREDDELHICREVWAEAYDDAAIAEEGNLCLTYSYGRDWKDGSILFERIGEVRLLEEE